jgi:hypothetical protein
MLAMPLSCGDDTTSPAPGDAAPGADAKVDTSTPDTGSKTDVTTDTKADTTQEAASEAATETGGGGDASDAGDAGDADVGAMETGTDAPADGDGGPQCGTPTDPTNARACLVFTGTDQVTPVTLDGAATDLDNMGTLLIYAFGVPNPGTGGPDGGPATPIAQPIAYPPPDDAGLFTTEMPVSALTSLPPIAIDVPLTTAYIVSYFVDNTAGFAAIQQGALTYGMYVGGISLAQGIQPVPPLNMVSLTAGQGTVVKQYLTVMREFKTVVTRAPALPDGGGGLVPPATGGDGTGPLAVGAYRTDVPDPMRVYGGALDSCVDIIRQEPYPVTGFFYTPTAGGQVWFGADLNDFGDTANVPPHGSFVSAVLNDAGTSVVPDWQSVMVGANDYVVTIPYIAFTATVPPAPATDFVHCPFLPDAGSDATGD